MSRADIPYAFSNQNIICALRKDTLNSSFKSFNDINSYDRAALPVILIIFPYGYLPAYDLFFFFFFFENPP